MHREACTLPRLLPVLAPTQHHPDRPLPSPPPLPCCCSGEWLELPADKVDVQLLGVAGEQLNSALTNPYFGML